MAPGGWASSKTEPGLAPGGWAPSRTGQGPSKMAERRAPHNAERVRALRAHYSSVVPEPDSQAQRAQRNCGWALVPGPAW